jgi:four helix bundle protein
MNTELLQRTKQFAVRILKAAETIEGTRGVARRAVAGQLARCGTSAAANYRATQRARSDAEFISKLHISTEEADESVFWMEVAIESGFVSATKLRLLLAEANELTAIFTTALKTTKQRLNAKSPHP